MESNLTEVEVFWVVTPWNVAVGYQRFEERCCLLPFSGWRYIWYTWYTSATHRVFTTQENL